jgi:hypothetical protein
VSTHKEPSIYWAILHSEVASLSRMETTRRRIALSSGIPLKRLRAAWAKCAKLGVPEKIMTMITGAARSLLASTSTTATTIYSSKAWT